MSKVGNDDFLKNDTSAEEVLRALETGTAGSEFEEFLGWEQEVNSLDQYGNNDLRGEHDFSAFSRPMGERVQGELKPRLPGQSGLNISLGKGVKL